MCSRYFAAIRQHYKFTLFKSLRGEAYNLAHPRYNPFVEPYRDMTAPAYAECLRRLFEPEAEAGIRVSTYRSRTQQPYEHVNRYFQDKLTLFEKAFPTEDQRPWREFYDQVARGLINELLKGFVRRFEPNPLDDVKAY